MIFTAPDLAHPDWSQDAIDWVRSVSLAGTSYTTAVASYYTGPVNIGGIIDSTGRDTTAAVAQRASQLLVLRPDNPAGNRVQLVPVSAPGSVLAGEPVTTPAVPLPVPAAPPVPVELADCARGAARPAGP